MIKVDSSIILTIIKIFIVVSLGALLTTLYGLINEQKIEKLYDNIEELKSSNVDLNDWSLTFSGNLSDMSSSIVVAKQKYELEKDEYRFCTRMLIIAKSVNLYEWFFDAYKNVLTNDQKIKFSFDKKLIEWKEFDEKVEGKNPNDICEIKRPSIKSGDYSFYRVCK